MKFKIIKDKEILKKKCATVTDINSAALVGTEMLDFLRRTANAVGLAANQVGINQQICVINVDKPIILINPKITNSFKKIVFQEGCLSFPTETVVTERYANIIVTSDNHDNPLYFTEGNLLESVCVQHEIDHLNGITMHDRKIDVDNSDKPPYTTSIF